MVNFRYILPQLKGKKERQAWSHKMILGSFRAGRALQVDWTKVGGEQRRVDPQDGEHFTWPILLSNILVWFLLSLCFFMKKVPLILVRGQDTSHQSCSLPVGGGSEDSSSLLLLCGGLGEPGLGLPSATGWRIGRYSI